MCGLFRLEPVTLPFFVCTLILTREDKQVVGLFRSGTHMFGWRASNVVWEEIIIINSIHIIQ
jgi:hypothetical protein